MARRKFDSSSAPAEIGVVPAEVVEANERVRKGAADDIAGRYAGDDAQELFRQLMKDLKEKRQQAKDAGESPADVKAIKFDQLKGTDTYEKWVEASREVEYAGWKEIEQNLRNKLDKAHDAGEDVEQSGGLFEQWEKANARFENISQARKEISHLKDKQAQILVEQARVAKVSERFPGSAPKLVVESNRLAADEAVVVAEVGAVGEIITGGDHSLAGLEADFAMVGDEDLEDLPAEAIMSFEKKNGTDMIQTFFSKELEKEAQKRINGPKGSLTKKDGFVVSLKEYVGDDGVFANLLLKDANFVKSVRNYFGTEVGVVGKAAETAALQFVHMLKEAREKYNKIKKEHSERIKHEEEPPEIPAYEETKSAFQPVLLELMGDMERSKNKLAKRQAELEALGSFTFFSKKAKEIRKDIWYTVADVNIALDRLRVLGDNIKHRRDWMHNSGSAEYVDKIRLYDILIEQIDKLVVGVKSKKEKSGSASFFDKFAKATALAALVFSVGGEAAHTTVEKPTDKPGAGGSLVPGVTKKPSAVFGGNIGGMSGMSEAQPDAPNGFTEAFDISGIPVASPLDGGASEPEPEVAGGSTSAGDLLKPAADTTIPTHGTHKLTKPGSKGSGRVEIASVNIGGGEAAVPAVEAVVAPAIASAEAAPKIAYTSREISEKIEQYSADHPELTAPEAGFIQTIYQASSTKGKGGFNLLAAAKTRLLLLNNTSGSKLEAFQSFVDGLQNAKDREKPATPKEGTPSLDEISKKIEKFSADTPNMTEKEIELTDLLYKASKSPGKAGSVSLKRAQNIFSFVTTSPERTKEFRSLIDDLSEAHKGDHSQIPDLVFSK